MAYIYDIADTWAASGTVFTGIKLNVTNTASAAGSSLMDLQVGGVSGFRVDKDAKITFGPSAGYAIIDGQSSAPGREIRIGSSVAAVLLKDNFTAAANYAAVSASSFFSWSTDPRLSVGDLILARDAANTLAQRNGVNAQAFNLYNTYTDASNYERGFMRFVSNVLEIGAQSAGTGTGRNVSISPGGTGTQIVSIATVGFQVFDLRYNATPFVQFQKYAGGGTTGWVSNASDIHYRWTASGTAAVEGDVGIKRDAAGVLKITNGNNAASGTGKLIFIVPTTDPGITGALWNNLGVLSISA